MRRSWRKTGSASVVEVST
uniref:Uncharacterized protein n=1 Tax=Arundo donax TaxID=35708 RepID=A0A0A8YED5_ARUDO